MNSFSFYFKACSCTLEQINTHGKKEIPIARVIFTRWNVPISIFVQNKLRSLEFYSRLRCRDVFGWQKFTFGVTINTFWKNVVLIEKPRSRSLDLKNKIRTELKSFYKLRRKFFAYHLLNFKMSRMMNSSAFSIIWTCVTGCVMKQVHIY